jgi:hypothetical protein
MTDIQKIVTPKIINRTAKDTSTLPISIIQGVNWNNQTPGVATFQSDIYTGLIQTAREIVEKYTWLDLTQATYQAYYDLSRYGLFDLFIANLRLGLNKAPIFNINNILTIEYLDQNTGAWDLFDMGTAEGQPGLYANVTERQEPNTWASLYFINPPPWANTINAYKARVTFTAGFDWPYTGTCTLSYNSTTGIVTAIAPVNLLNNNNMTITITGATQGAYNVNGKALTSINNTTFTYQLATGLSITPDTGSYASQPSNIYTMPFTLGTTIKEIVAYSYSTRGDVPSGETLNGYPVPAGTKAKLDLFSVSRTKIGQDF